MIKPEPTLLDWELDKFKEHTSRKIKIPSKEKMFTGYDGSTSVRFS